MDGSLMEAKPVKVKTASEVLEKARKRFQQCQDDEHANRVMAIDDLSNYVGEQWPERTKQLREQHGRPCLVFNRLIGFVDQVTGDQRQNRPRINVRPVDSRSDPETAKIINGIIRNIENVSRADDAYDNAIHSSVVCGYGAFRVLTEYADDDVFDQDIRIKKIDNPFSVYWDPTAREYSREDAKYAFVFEKISRDEYESKYPDSPIQSFSEEFGASGSELLEWVNDDAVTVAEYWVKEDVVKTIYQLQDGTVTESPEDAGLVVRTRKVNGHKVVWYKINGTEILEGPNDWPGVYIPLVPVWGKEINIQGKRSVWGLVRYSKDPQRAYNYARSIMMETLALAPRVPYLVTAEHISGHESEWEASHVKNLPYLTYNADPQAPQGPKRETGAVTPSGWIDEVRWSSEEMKQTTGIYDASLGAKSNETSGRAILARQREGDTSTFAYIDNLGKSLMYAGRILVDLIPKIYDTQRIVRIIGEDGKDDFAPVNHDVLDPATLTFKRLNDLTVGKYDVTVTVGPSYTTQRIEATNMMIDFVRAVPAAGQVIGDLLAKNMDWPGAEEIAKRLEKILPPQLLADDGHQGMRPPEGGQQPGGPPGQPPAQMRQAMEAQAMAAQAQQARMRLELEKAALQLEQEKARRDGLVLDNLLKRQKLGIPPVAGQPGMGTGPGMPPSVGPLPPRPMVRDVRP
jgi:hypothetical protein